MEGGADILDWGEEKMRARITDRGYACKSKLLADISCTHQSHSRTDTPKTDTDFILHGIVQV